MKIKKLLGIVMALMLSVMLCGCEFFPVNTDELLKPPALTGNYAPIEEALKSAVSGYTLRYPSVGDYRSSFVMQDIDGDGKDEAFAFYSLADDEMHIHLILRGKKKKWYSADDQTVTAGDVERVSFYDLNGDGTLEILVGWEVLPVTDKQLAVYEYVNKKLVQRKLVAYSDYLTCDLDGDGATELFVQTVDPNNSANTATLYRLRDDGVTTIAKCKMDRNVKSVVALTAATLSDGTPAIYADELKSGGAVTEVLFLKNGKLCNPLLETASAENIQTARAASLLCQDIDGDGKIEIPVAAELPAIDPQTAQKAYYTRWCAFSGNTLTPVETVIINQADGYSLKVPEKWIGKIGVERNGEQRSRIFFACDDTGAVAARLFELRAVDVKSWKTLTEWAELGRTADTVIAGRVFESAHPLSVTTEMLKEIIEIKE